VVFSGDKLLGGPQAGIIVGPEDTVRRAATNPLARALRPDKFTLAALEATLAIQRDPDAARAEIPVLAMLTADPAEIARRAERLAQQLSGATVEPGESAVGGGAFPGSTLPTTLVRLPASSPDEALAKLRRHTPPVIARAADNAVLFDVRTMSDDEFAAIVSAVGGQAMA
jgi:L-seryl-tRNA(Ser) seleniumtransferase